MEPPHISVFLFGITWMQHVVNDRLAVEVQCIGLPDRQTIPLWIISSGAMKSLVFETPVNSAEELVARISAAAGEIRNTPEMLSNVRRSMKRRCEACITCGGRHYSLKNDAAYGGFIGPDGKWNGMMGSLEIDVAGPLFINEARSKVVNFAFPLDFADLVIISGLIPANKYPNLIFGIFSSTHEKGYKLVGSKFTSEAMQVEKWSGIESTRSLMTSRGRSVHNLCNWVDNSPVIRYGCSCFQPSTRRTLLARGLVTWQATV
ncbi:lig_chan-Glu_bd domain-containing protein [Trichonephila clavipes]|nr:lig_chan-Glu_bd domain-containing protein [Trichonephila clavipes]